MSKLLWSWTSLLLLLCNKLVCLEDCIATGLYSASWISHTYVSGHINQMQCCLFIPCFHQPHCARKVVSKFWSFNSFHFQFFIRDAHMQNVILPVHLQKRVLFPLTKARPLLDSTKVPAACGSHEITERVWGEVRGKKQHHDKVCTCGQYVSMF